MGNAISVIMNIAFLFLCNCESTQKTDKPGEQVPEIEPIILQTFYHDTLAFTQGLLYYKDKLYESTGLYNRSSIRCINTDNGYIEKNVPVENVFAEGLVIKNNIFILLTWKSELAFLYSYPDLKRIDTLQYQGEGWGLTSDGNSFIMSNGSDTLYWRDDHFNILKKIPVTLNELPLKRLNELEYARNRIYANVWYSDFIFEIEPKSGKVIRMINCKLLLNHLQFIGTDEVLNGIAYKNSSDTFFLTGKRWPLIFEIQIPD
jgi:glutamine cyclotransferase